MKSVNKIELLRLLQQTIFVAITASTLWSYPGVFAVNKRKVVDDMMKTYDRRVLPLEHGEPLNVSVGVFINDLIPHTQDGESVYTYEMYFRCEWVDFRLAYGKVLRETYNETVNDSDLIIYQGDFSDLIWKPDLYFINSKRLTRHSLTKPNKFNLLYANGKIYSSERLTVTSWCDMNMSSYPFDQQQCKSVIESYTYDQTFLQLHWADGKGSIGRSLLYPENVLQSTNGFEMKARNVYVGKTFTRYSGSEIYDSLYIGFHLERNVQYYLIQMYLPTVLIVFLSWIGFWIDYKSTKARVSLCATTVLTVVVLGIKIKRSRGSQSAMDGYLLLCFVYVFANLLEYVFVGITNLKWTKHKSDDKSKNVKYVRHRKGWLRKHSKATEQESKNTSLPETVESQNPDHFVPPVDLDLVENATCDTKDVTSNIEVETERNDLFDASLLEAPLGSPKDDEQPVDERQFELLQVRYKKKKTSTLKMLYKKHQNQKHDQVHIIDKISRYVFPISFLFCNIVYFIWLVHFNTDKNLH